MPAEHISKLRHNIGIQSFEVDCKTFDELTNSLAIIANSVEKFELSTLTNPVMNSWEIYGSYKDAKADLSMHLAHMIGIKISVFQHYEFDIIGTAKQLYCFKTMFHTIMGYTIYACGQQEPAYARKFHAHSIINQALAYLAENIFTSVEDDDEE